MDRMDGVGSGIFFSVLFCSFPLRVDIHYVLVLMTCLNCLDTTSMYDYSFGATLA